MKILILSSNLSNEAGGYSESSFLLRERLERIKKNDVYLFGFWKSKMFRLNYKLVDRINIFSPGFIKIFPFSISYFKKMKIIKPDIIDAQGLWSSSTVFNIFFNFFTSTPYVVTPRGMLERWAMEKSFIKKKIFYLMFEQFHLKNAKCLRATSLMEAKTFLKLGFKNTIVNVPNSIKIPNLKNKSLIKKKTKYRLLFLSRFHPKKGLSELLHAWKFLQDKNLNWELVICGYDEKQYLKKMKYLEKNLKLKRVIWKNFLVGKEKDRIFRSCDLFVLLSYSENFGLAIAEALSYRLPVITTLNTPWKNLNKKKCGWCISLKMSKIVKTLNYAMKLDPKKRFIMGSRGRKWVISDFSDKSIGIKMNTVYKWILNKGPKPKKLVLN